MTARTDGRLVLFFLIFFFAVARLNTSAQTPPQKSAKSESQFAPDKMETVLYGVAYYPEYMPHDRLDKDVELMQKAGITVVRVGIHLEHVGAK